MAVRISVKKEKNIPGCGNRWRAWLACVRAESWRAESWRAESWRADVGPHKEKKKIQEKKTYLGVDDGRVCACRCVACGCRLV